MWQGATTIMIKVVDDNFAPTCPFWKDYPGENSPI